VPALDGEKKKHKVHLFPTRKKSQKALDEQITCTANKRQPKQSRKSPMRRSSKLSLPPPRIDQLLKHDRKKE